MTPSDETLDSDTLFSIEPTNVAQSLRDLYFKEGKGSVFTYRSTRIPMLLTLIFIIFSALLYLLSLTHEQVSYVIVFTLSNLIWVWFLIRCLLNVKKYFKWRRAVDAMIKTVESYKKVCVNVKAFGFEAIYDDQIVIEKWGNFERATIVPTHIYLFQKGADYLFPAKSMKESEFEALSQIVRNNIAGNC
jgi:hypothetical protein